MPRTGSYPKGLAKREELIDVALEVIARHGYDGATLREVSDAAGLSKTGLLHHFGSKEELFVEVLRRRDALSAEAHLRERGDGGPEIAGAIGDVVRHNAEVPGLVALYTRLSAEATDPRNPAHGYFRERYAQTRRLIESAALEMRDAGRLPASVDPRTFAVLLIALMDGLQVQWMFDSALDMAEHVEQLFDLVCGRAPD